MPYCELLGQANIYYEDFGSGLPIVFTNAGNLTHKMWTDQVAFLAPQFRTITYDICGTGFSSKPRGDYTADIAASDLCALIDQLELRQVTLVAHGIGTHIVNLAVEKRPDLVNGLVLVSGGPWFCGERDGIKGGASVDFLDFLAKRMEDGIPYAEMCGEMIETWLFHMSPGPGLVHSVLEQALTWPKFVLKLLSESMRQIDHRERFSRLTCPVLILHGRHDCKQLYSGAVHMARLIRNARLVTLEKSAHMGQLEEPHIFNQALLNFVREINAGRPAI